MKFKPHIIVLILQGLLTTLEQMFAHSGRIGQNQHRAAQNARFCNVADDTAQSAHAAEQGVWSRRQQHIPCIFVAWCSGLLG